MKIPYPITPDFDLPRPLQEGDQAIIDAVQQIEPGARGKVGYDFIERQLPVERSVGTYGELVLGSIINEVGQQEFTFIDVMPIGIMAGVEVREPGSRKSSVERQLALPNKVQRSFAEAQEIKLEAARIIKSANEATKKLPKRSLST